MTTPKYDNLRKSLEREYNHCCAACGCTLAGLAIDHCTSRSDGGSDEISNLQILCYVCNSDIKNEVSLDRFPPRQPCNNARKVEVARRAFRKLISKVKKMRKAA